MTTTQTSAPLARALLSWDAPDEGLNFPGFYHPDQRWNGFACPEFEREVADRIMAWNNNARADAPDIAERIRFDPLLDAYLIDNPEAYPGERPEIVYGADFECADGVTRHLYSIGSWAWTWVEYDPMCDNCGQPFSVHALADVACPDASGRGFDGEVIA